MGIFRPGSSDLIFLLLFPFVSCLVFCIMFSLLVPLVFTEKALRTELAVGSWPPFLFYNLWWYWLLWFLFLREKKAEQEYSHIPLRIGRSPTESHLGGGSLCTEIGNQASQANSCRAPQTWWVILHFRSVVKRATLSSYETLLQYRGSSWSLLHHTVVKCLFTGCQI